MVVCGRGPLPPSATSYPQNRRHLCLPQDSHPPPPWVPPLPHTTATREWRNTTPSQLTHPCTTLVSPHPRRLTLRLTRRLHLTLAYSLSTIRPHFDRTFNSFHPVPTPVSGLLSEAPEMCIEPKLTLPTSLTHPPPNPGTHSHFW